MMFFKGILNIYIYENQMPKELYLDNIKLYDQDEFLGEIKINENLTNSKDKKYTNDGKLILKVNLKNNFIEILEAKEKKLEISRYGVSRGIRFLFEFHDKDKDEKYIIMNYYKVSKYDKGWEFWLPDI